MSVETETILIEEDLSQNQFLLVFERAFYWILHAVVKYSLYAAHYLTLPSIFCFAFCNYAIDQTWQITVGIFNELKEFLKPIPLMIQIFYWSTVLSIQTLLMVKTAEQIGVEVEKKIYKPLTIILSILRFDFSDPKHAAALFGFFTSLRIFGNYLPFPFFLFAKVFKTVTFRKRALTIVVTAPEEETIEILSSETVEPGSSQTSDKKPDVLARLNRKKTSPKLQSVDEKNEDLPNPENAENDL